MFWGENHFRLFLMPVSIVLPWRFETNRKDFVINAIDNYLEQKGKDVIAVATSVVVSRLLCKWQTAVIPFFVPIAYSKDFTCHIDQGFDEASNLKQADFDFLDAMVMCIRHNTETGSKAQKDLMCSILTGTVKNHASFRNILINIFCSAWRG